MTEIKNEIHFYRQSGCRWIESETDTDPRDYMDHRIFEFRTLYVQPASTVVNPLWKHDIESAITAVKMRGGESGTLAGLQEIAGYLAAPIAPALPVEAEKKLTDADIEKGWHATFSTSNPYCPCNLKSFTKAVNWAVRMLQGSKP